MKRRVCLDQWKALYDPCRRWQLNIWWVWPSKVEVTQRPIVFASLKLNSTQRAWSTIEKEAFVAISALGKFRSWIFGQPVTIYSDHNPLTYITDSVTKSSKLTRWYLPLQQYDVTFRYKAVRNNVVADCLSRTESDDDLIILSPH